MKISICFKPFENMFNPVHPTTSNLFKRPFGVSPVAAHRSWCTAQPLEQDLPQLRHLTIPKKKRVPKEGFFEFSPRPGVHFNSLMFNNFLIVWRKEKWRLQRESIQICVDLGRSFCRQRCLGCGTSLQLRSWGRAYPPQSHHSLGVPEGTKQRPIEANTLW